MRISRWTFLYWFAVGGLSAIFALIIGSLLAGVMIWLWFTVKLLGFALCYFEIFCG